MVTGADSDALLVERDTYILAANIVENEREHARFLTRCADQLQAGYGEQTRRGVVQKLVFVGSNTFHADLFDIVERRAEPNRVRNIASARFKPRRSYVVSGLLEGDVHNAIRLEQLWNNVARIYPLSLRCAYPMSAFDREEHGDLFLKICAEHSFVIPVESYTALVSVEQRLRSISHLQQKAQALESEMAERRQVEEALRRTALEC